MEGQVPGDGILHREAENLPELRGQEVQSPAFEQVIQGPFEKGPVPVQFFRGAPGDAEGRKKEEVGRIVLLFQHLGGIDGEEGAASLSGPGVGEKTEEGVQGGESALFHSCGEQGGGLFELPSGKEKQGVEHS